jgi:predicted regulator of Ras-like GTPase activity (Roadblock/LC7/MglB family)
MTGLRPRRDPGGGVHTADDFSRYAGHPIRLEYQQASRDGVIYTDWVLFVDERMLYLGQDGRFVRQVLGQDFAAFIHEAFRRAGITTSSQSPRLAGDFAPDLLRASLAAAEDTGLGALHELSIETERMTALLVSITPDYFLFASFAPGALIGRARFALGLAKDGLAREFA